MAETRDETAVPQTRGVQRTQPPCDVCGGPTYEVRCEIICRRCGFTRDCSDP